MGWRALMTAIGQMLRPARQVSRDDLELAQQYGMLDPDAVAGNRREELDWLRAYQRELEYRLRAMELDAAVIGRQRARSAGRSE